MTGRDLVSACLRLIGALAPGEAPEASEATDGLAALNRMISSWSTDSLMIHAKVREEFTLTPSDGSYTLGASGDFNTSRPISIESATIENQSVSPTQESPLTIIDDIGQWAEIIAKDQTNEIPTHLYVEWAFPQAVVKLWPVPSTAHKVVLYSIKPLTEIATLDTAISLPPGYERALVFNGALELAPEYGKAVDALVMKSAEESKSQIMRRNQTPVYLKCDSALVADGSFNIMTGDYR